MKGFLRELRARNVDRAALAYAGAGWLLAQGGQLLADAYRWPDWVIRALLAALMLGFPLVLVLAWFFEWTPAASWPTARADPRPRSGCARTKARPRDRRAALRVLGYLAATWNWREPNTRTRAGASGAGRDPGSSAVQAAPRRHA